jgi:hypothetical protein
MVSVFIAVAFTFTNRTGSVVYLSRARLREHHENFSIPSEAIRDIFGWREIKFPNQATGLLEDHEHVLHTDQHVQTSIAYG